MLTIMKTKNKKIMSTQNEKFMNNAKKKIMSEKTEKWTNLETVNMSSFEIKSCKSLDKYWFKMNEKLPLKCRCETLECSLENIKFSKDCIAIWTDHNNSPNLMTTGLTDDLLESIVVRMVNDEPLREFFALAVTISKDYIKDNNKGIEILKICSKYVKEKLADYVPEDTDEIEIFNNKKIGN